MLRKLYSVAVAFWATSMLLVALVLHPAAGQQVCPQNLGSCKCIPPSVPGAALKPVLDCSQVSDGNDFLEIQGLQGSQPGGAPVFSQIIVRRSKLQEIPANAFGIAQADEIIIENNPELDVIEPAAFGVMANPRLISIRNNPLLETVKFDDFARYSNLEILRLNDNRLQDVPNMAFDGISRNLREVYLQRNVITDLGQFVFRNLPALKIVNLAENIIGALESGSLFFSSPPDLVDLARNRIVTVDGEAFSDPQFPNKGAYAKHIDLSGNNIAFLDRIEWEPIFTQIDKLEKIANPTPPPPTTEAPPLVDPLAAQQASPAAAPAAVEPSPLAEPTAVAAAAPAAAAAAAAASEPRSASPDPATAAAEAVKPESILLQILERLQLLTGALGSTGTLPSPGTPGNAVFAATLTKTSPLRRLRRNVASVVETAAAAAGDGATSSNPVTSSANAVVSAFQPFFKGREELMGAIKTNPAAAVAAANAVKVAAEAAVASATAVESAAAGAAEAVERAVVAAAKGLPNEDIAEESSARRKRQVEPTPGGAGEPPVRPASIYTINFSGNPVSCNCESKWVVDFRHRYEDQLQNLVCTETRDSIFRLGVQHWSQLQC